MFSILANSLKYIKYNIKYNQFIWYLLFFFMQYQVMLKFKHINLFSFIIQFSNIRKPHINADLIDFIN